MISGTSLRRHLLYLLNLQPTMDLTMGVHGRDLGHVADDVNRVVAKYGIARSSGGWTPFDPDAKEPKPMEGGKIVLSGEYQKMQDTFRYQAMGMAGAVLLIYFLMVALFKSYVTPLVVLSAVPVGVVGVVLESVPYVGLCRHSVVKLRVGVFAFESIEHQVDHRQLDERLRGSHTLRPIQAQSTTLSAPRNCPRPVSDWGAQCAGAGAYDATRLGALANAVDQSSAALDFGSDPRLGFCATMAASLADRLDL